MKKSKSWVPFIIFLVFIVISGFTLFKYIRYGEIDGAGILFSFIVLSYLFNYLNNKCKNYLQEKDRRKWELIKRYADLEVKWEHEIREELKKDVLMKEYFDNWIDCSPIKIRDAFHGGNFTFFK